LGAAQDTIKAEGVAETPDDTSACPRAAEEPGVVVRLPNGFRVRDSNGQWMVEKVGAKTAHAVAFHIDRDEMIRRLPAIISALVPDDAFGLLRALPARHLGPRGVAEPSEEHELPEQTKQKRRKGTAIARRADKARERLATTDVRVPPSRRPEPYS
jgi:hypothetical protein